MPGVALRKESVDRKKSYLHCVSTPPVALRKESVDRKTSLGVPDIRALRSLSARRAWIEKSRAPVPHLPMAPSLSARRAWIEKPTSGTQRCWNWVALRKESVDRKIDSTVREDNDGTVALRKESVDRKAYLDSMPQTATGRSPQGERG